MCGIAGIVGNAEYNDLKMMIMTIQHRGPDYQGIEINNDIGLAHARLSIIDLSKDGNQPLWDNEGYLSIVFNGEIYNYESLKKELDTKYTFKSKSDTEVLIYLYKEYGKNLLQKIEGMFTFAIYDFRKNELFIAKDRMGKKPLYYAQKENSFLFASELRAILSHPTIDKRINISGVNQFLTFDYVPTPMTMIEGVYKLESAHYLIVRDNRIIEKKRYWSCDYTLNNTISFEDASFHLDFLLNEAVKKRLMSDVPLGVFLSGGLDSSTIAYYAQKNTISKLNTFSIGFNEKSYDESFHAKLVADYLGCDHYCEVLTPEKTLSLIDEIFPYMDEPFADASLIPTYYLSKITRKNVTVALGGDGSDELMAGYPTFISNKLINFFYSTGKIPLIPLKLLYNLLPVSDDNISLDFKIKQFIRGFSSKKEYTHQLWLGSFLPNEKKQLFRQEINVNVNNFTLIDSVFTEVKSQTQFNQITHYYLRTYLHDDILYKIDRASMLNSLEVRAPFLDMKLVEFLNSLPQEYKIKGVSGKYILKKIMLNKLPSEIITRPKKGFGIPLSKWLRSDLSLLLDEHFSKTNLDKSGLFNFEFIQQLRMEHNQLKKNHRKLLWNLLVLQLYISYNDLRVN